MAVGIFGTAGAGAEVEAVAQWFPWRCPFHLLTGWLCPGCGLTRSVLAGLSGDWSLAFRFHPLGPLILVFSGILWAYCFLEKVAFLQFSPLPGFYKKIQGLPVYVVLIVLVGWTVWRNTPLAS